MVILERKDLNPEALPILQFNTIEDFDDDDYVRTPRRLRRCNVERRPGRMFENVREPVYPPLPGTESPSRCVPFRLAVLPGTDRHDFEGEKRPCADLW